MNTVTNWQQIMMQKQNAIEHEQNQRAKVDQPTVVRVKHLVITELTVTTLFAWVFDMSIRCHAVGFLLFQKAHSWPFGTQRTLQQLCCFLPTT